MKYLVLGRSPAAIVVAADSNVSIELVRQYAAATVEHGEGTSSLVVTPTGDLAVEDTALRAAADGGLELRTRGVPKSYVSVTSEETSYVVDRANVAAWSPWAKWVERTQPKRRNARGL